MNLLVLAYLLVSLITYGANGQHNVAWSNEGVSASCVVNLAEESFDYSCTFTGIDNVEAQAWLQNAIDQIGDFY